jgi:hypothetical protein
VTDVDEVFDLKKLQNEQRQQKVAEFGEVGVKTDCKHCVEHPNGKKGCTILHKMYCKYEVCHFYDKGDS